MQMTAFCVCPDSVLWSRDFIESGELEEGSRKRKISFFSSCVLILRKKSDLRKMEIG